MDENSAAYQDLVTLWINSLLHDPTSDAHVLLDLLTAPTEDEWIDLKLEDNTYEET